MRKVIEGKLYDTDTAQLIHAWSSGHYAGDFHRVDEALYRTQSGTWFLHGEGGALSPWSSRVGNQSGRGEAIVPMDGDEARAWMERRDAPASIIEAHFTVSEA